MTTERAEINIERVARRVREGGRNVPVDKIRERYRRTMRLLALAIERAIALYVLDSSQRDERTGDPFIFTES